MGYDYLSGGWHDITFTARPVADRSARNVALPLTGDVALDREHLLPVLGATMTATLLELVASQQISGSFKEFNLLRGDAASGWQWVLLVGVGRPAACREAYRWHDRVRSLGAMAARHFRRKNLLSFAVPSFAAFGVEAERAASLLAEGIHLGLYRFERYKSPHNVRYDEAHQLQEVVMLVDAPSAEVSRGFATGTMMAQATYLARNLVNTPAQDLTPSAFAEVAEEIAAKLPGVHAESLGPEALRAARMPMLLAVAQGSALPPAMSVLTYTPKGADAGYDLCVLGKGITFDTGGYNLKPDAAIGRMYGDMAGGAAALGAICAVASLGIPLNMAVVVPLAENMVSGNAFRPSDILYSRKGLSVEVANTDAEGRLVLADAIDYACERFAPRVMLDIATLTGSMRVALGNFVSGFFLHSDTLADDRPLEDALMDAGRNAGEWLWRFPLDEVYQVQLASDVADLESCETDPMAGAGAITAAMFLKQFVKFDSVSAWIHIDIAATALMQRTLIYSRAPYHPKEGGTGVGVRLLTLFASHLAQHLPTLLGDAASEGG